MLKLIVLVIIINCQSSEIKQVIHFFRHGARTSQKNIYDLKEFKELGASKLTDVGKLQHLLLGNIIFKRYKNLLDYETTLFLTSPKSRCKNSWLFEMYSIYHKNEIVTENITIDKIINFNVNKQNIPTIDTDIKEKFTKKYEEKADLFTSGNCKKIKTLSKNINNINNTNYKIIITKFKNYLNNKYIQLEIKKHDLLEIIDNIISIYYYNKEHDIVKDIIKEDFEMINDFLSVTYYYFYEENEEYLKIKCRNLIKFWKENIKKNKNDKINNSFIFLSAHDQNIDSFLYLLLKNKNNPECLLNKFTKDYSDKLKIEGIEVQDKYKDIKCVYKTKFASSIQFEISEEKNNSDKNYIDVIFDGNIENKIFSGTVEDFFKLFKNYEINDDSEFEKKCKVDPPRTLFKH